MGRGDSLSVGFRGAGMSLDWLMIPVALADSADGGLWPAAVAISGIVMFSSCAIVKSIIRHRERMRKPVRVESDVGDADVTARGPMRNFAGD